MDGMKGIILLSFMVMVSFNVFAQDTRIIHSGDYYSVSFDGEGDAIVRAKLVMENLSKESVSELRLEMPERTIVYKILQHSEAEPLEFETEHGSEHTLVTVHLGKPLNYNETTSIIILYKASELAEMDFLGNFNFDFKTIVDRQAVLTEKIRVAVNTQPGYFLKGGTPHVDYKRDFFGESMVMKAASMEERAFRQYYDNIENASGQMVRETSNLDMLESFHVKGTYSSNIFSLLANELLISAAVVLVIGIVGISLYLRKR